MTYYAKEYIKIYSIILLIILTLRNFKKCNGSVRNQITTGLKTGAIIPTIIYLFNV